MLILTRRVGETLMVGDDVTISVLGVKGNQVRIGVNAPKEVSVHREEIYMRIQNEKSNQKNVGVIKSSNLCAEIVEYSVKDETAVCNLASIALPKFVNKQEKKYDYNNLYKTAKLAAKNLDQVIDINYYPTKIGREDALVLAKTLSKEEL